MTEQDKLRCAEREAKMRRRVYQRWVEQGRMTQKQADHEIACMEAIAADYRKIVMGERLI
jgi:hypothetical protein